MTRPWDTFFKERITRILKEKETVIDIGGGLRVAKDKNNRYDKKRAWALPLLEGVDYKVLDPVPDYNPDIVGDIHNLPFEDDSVDALLCIAVLEHVENPIQAAKEMYRVLKPGGYLFVYVPFLYYYHAEKGYYGDYWRFTKDTLDVLFRDFSEKEIVSVRGALETWVKLGPLGRSAFICGLAHMLDKLTGKIQSAQTSGYNVFLVK
ncbi:methyltransferase domain-containing protein [Candidatus Kaiserbacteria bacterium]|nr:methyltransferase domain-containing protein [Candidatus Kaiserbacteria bacterium]